MRYEALAWRTLSCVCSRWCAHMPVNCPHLWTTLPQRLDEAVDQGLPSNPAACAQGLITELLVGTAAGVSSKETKTSWGSPYRLGKWKDRSCYHHHHLREQGTRSQLAGV